MYTFQLNGTLASLWLRESPHDNSVHIAGKRHVFARAAKEPTDYENVPICLFGYFLLLQGRFKSWSTFPYAVNERSGVGGQTLRNHDFALTYDLIRWGSPTAVQLPRV